MKKKPIIITTAFLLLVAVFIGSLAFYKNATTVDDFETVATVNGYEICAKELRLQMSIAKPYIIEQYQDYDITEKFWNTKINGKKTIEILRERALETLIRYKVEQNEAVKCKILKKNTTDYQSFLKSLELENKTRQEKINRGEIVYGAKEYTESSYFTYIYSNMQIANAEILGEKGGTLYANNATLKKWYEEVKAERYPKFDTIELDYYYLSPEQKNANSIIKKVEKSLKSGNYDYVNQNVGKLFNYKIITVDDNSASDVQKLTPQFFETLQTIKVGEVSNAFFENNQCFVTICKSREKAGYKSFEEHKNAIYSEYISEQYAKYIDDLVKKAKVETLKKFQYVNL